MVFIGAQATLKEYGFNVIFEYFHFFNPSRIIKYVLMVLSFVVLIGYVIATILLAHYYKKLPTEEPWVNKSRYMVFPTFKDLVANIFWINDSLISSENWLILV